MSLLPRGGVRDAWAPRLPGTGGDHHGRRTHQAVFHRSGGLDRPQCRPQWRLQPAATLGEPFREHKRRLGSIHLHLGDPAGRPSPPGRFAPGSRSVRRNKLPQVSTTLTPTTPASRRVDAPAWGVWERAGRTSGPQRRPAPPTERDRPMGEWGAYPGPRPRPAGMVLVRSAHAEGIVRTASSALLKREGKGAPAYADALDVTTPSWSEYMSGHYFRRCNHRSAGDRVAQSSV